MKRTLAILFVTLLLAVSSSALAVETVSIGASPVPHTEILEFIKPLMEEKGFTLELVRFEDYVLPNTAVESGDLDANYFQHTNYLFDFNAKQNTHLVPVIPVHFEPMGVFKGKTDSLDALPDGAEIGVPNDTSNQLRALQLLESLGLIKLSEDADTTSILTQIIAENEKNLKFIEVEAAQLPHMLQDFDLAVINGNYAMGSGLVLADDTVGAESWDPKEHSGAVNYIVVKEGNEDAAFLDALREALNDQRTIDFMTERYQGSFVLALDAEIPTAE